VLPWIPKYLVLLRRIDRQKDAVPKRAFKAFDGAILIATGARAAADADGADHLAVDYDRNPAGACEESELNQLARIAARIVSQLRVADRGRLPRLQCGLCFQHCSMDVGVDLAVASFLMNESAMSIEDIY